LLIAAGATPGNTPATVALILLAATAGVFVGSTILYTVVRRGGRPVLNRTLEQCTTNWLPRFAPERVYASGLLTARA
jgi:membrane protein DedA with SNARE-associated domain